MDDTKPAPIPHGTPEHKAAAEWLAEVLEEPYFQHLREHAATDGTVEVDAGVLRFLLHFTDCCARSYEQSLCAWCGAQSSADKFREHALRCPKNPLVHPEDTPPEAA